MKKRALSLPEVLITLTILGIIAIFFLRGIIPTIDEKITVSKVKKAYYTLNQSFQKAVMTYGPAQNWGLTQSIANKYDDEENIIEQGSLPFEHETIAKILTGIKVKDISGTKNECHYFNKYRVDCPMHFADDNGFFIMEGMSMSRIVMCSEALWQKFAEK